ncbi:hypothetical protein NDU88_001612 [Pleurodeles waltl]|uniref:Uncharacterized protein n=1 Tax=Pleurodeles waltl TaxID=8319 RepID=A0AAV7LZ31_PLEWA|nr:hypothetical protein NDU88_001612 [Pleurodeles waltl]
MRKLKKKRNIRSDLLALLRILYYDFMTHRPGSIQRPRLINGVLLVPRQRQQNIPSSKSRALGSWRLTLDLDACAAHAVLGFSFYNKFFRKSHHRIGLLYLYSNTR